MYGFAYAVHSDQAFFASGCCARSFRGSATPICASGNFDQPYFCLLAASEWLLGVGNSFAFALYVFASRGWPLLDGFFSMPAFPSFFLVSHLVSELVGVLKNSFHKSLVMRSLRARLPTDGRLATGDGANR